MDFYKVMEIIIGWPTIVAITVFALIGAKKLSFKFLDRFEKTRDSQWREGFNAAFSLQK